MAIPSATLILAAGALLAGCAEPAALTVRVTPVHAYRAYGEYHPVAEDDALVARSASADVSRAKIRIFQEALPAGIRMDGALLGVEKGFRHRLLGKFAYSSGKEEPKDELVLRVRRLCVTVGANAAMILFHQENEKDRARAQAIEAVLMHYEDPSPEGAPPPPSPSL